VASFRAENREVRTWLREAQSQQSRAEERAREAEQKANEADELKAALAAKVAVTEPPKIIPYYRLSWSTWPLSNNKELLSRFRRVKPGKSHTTGSLICAKPTRRRDQSTTLHYIKVHKFLNT
jgi:hypothetical protein